MEAERLLRRLSRLFQPSPHPSADLKQEMTLEMKVETEYIVLHNEMSIG